MVFIWCPSRDQACSCTFSNFNSHSALKFNWIHSAYLILFARHNRSYQSESSHKRGNFGPIMNQFALTFVEQWSILLESTVGVLLRSNQTFQLYFLPFQPLSRKYFRFLIKFPLPRHFQPLLINSDLSCDQMIQFSQWLILGQISFWDAHF